jgi:hypothetical protein
MNVPERFSRRDSLLVEIPGVCFHPNDFRFLKPEHKMLGFFSGKTGVTERIGPLSMKTTMNGFRPGQTTAGPVRKPVVSSARIRRVLLFAFFLGMVLG